MSAEVSKVQCFLGREEIDSKREITDGATTDAWWGSSKHGLASSCVLALRLSLEGKATSRVLSLFLLPGLCQISQSCPMPASLYSESGKMFSSFERSWSVWRRRILSIAVAYTCLASTHVEILCWEVWVLRIYILLRRLE